MRIFRRMTGSRTSFIIADLDTAYHQAARDLAFQSHAEGFARTFPEDTPDLDTIFNHFARSAELMVLQTAKAAPVPWALALNAFLDRVDGASLDWWLGGSAALAVRGAPLTPRDLDLIVDDASARRLGDLLADCLVEPVIPVEGWLCNWWGRAFLHARIEWVGGVGAQADEPEVSDFGPKAAARLETVEWQGRGIRVPPLDLQLQVSRRRGLTERVSWIQRLLDRDCRPGISGDERNNDDG